MGSWSSVCAPPFCGSLPAHTPLPSSRVYLLPPLTSLCSTACLAHIAAAYADEEAQFFRDATPGICESETSCTGVYLNSNNRTWRMFVLFFSFSTSTPPLFHVRHTAARLYTSLSLQLMGLPQHHQRTTKHLASQRPHHPVCVLSSPFFFFSPPVSKTPFTLTCTHTPLQHTARSKETASLPSPLMP